jgi:hypothetical protein
MPATKRTGLIAVNVRLPESLHKSLKKQAKKKGIPLNTEIVNRLEGYEADTVDRVTAITQPIINAAVKKEVQHALTATINMFTSGATVPLTLRDAEPESGAAPQREGARAVSKPDDQNQK